MQGRPRRRFPRLLKATPAQRAAVSVSPMGLHWDALDEDISVDGLLKGQPDFTRRVLHAAKGRRLRLSPQIGAPGGNSGSGRTFTRAGSSR